MKFENELKKYFKKININIDNKEDEDSFKVWLKEKDKLLSNIDEKEKIHVENTIKLAVIKMFSKAKKDAQSKDRNKGFFSYEDLFNIPLLKKHFPIVNVNGDRNIGKSYSSKKMARDVVYKKKKRFLILRNQDDEVSGQFKSDMDPDNGWLAKCGWKHTGSVKMPDIVNDDENIVGSYRALNTSGKLKSVDIPNVGLIIYEEFNAVKIADSIGKFTKLVSTVQRFEPELKIIVQANYTDQHNEFIQFLGMPATKLKKEDIVIFNWLLGSVIINIPKNIYRQPDNIEKDLGQRTALNDYNAWKNQFGGGFNTEEPINIINSNEITEMDPIFNLYIETNVGKSIQNNTYGSYKLTLYNALNKQFKTKQVLMQMTSNNDKPIFVLNYLSLIKYPSANLISITALNQILNAWMNNSIFTTNLTEHNIITNLLALCKKEIDKDVEFIEEIENLVK